MLTGSAWFLAGTLILVSLSDPPPAAVFLLAPLCGGIFSRRLLWRAPAWCLAGFLLAALRAVFILGDGLAESHEGRDLLVTGRIDSLPEIRSDVVRFVLAVDSLQTVAGAAVPVPGRLRLSWYRAARVPRAGQAWRLRVRLKRPVGFANPGGFDYEAWLFRQRIRATGYVVRSPANGLLDEARVIDVDHWRDRLRVRLAELSGDTAHEALIRALALGDQSGISAAQRAVLSRSGTAHLLAVSGLHIGLVASLVLLALRRGLSGLGVLWPGMHGRYVAAAAAGLAATGYALLAGFSTPTQRALVMTGFGLYALTARPVSAWALLSAALLAVLLLDPFAVLAPGFWLSFIAVAVLVWGLQGRHGPLTLLARFCQPQVVVAIGLAPLTLLVFQQLPVAGLVANCVAIPWVSLVTVPLALSAVVLLLARADGAAAVLIDLAHVSLQGLWPFLELIAGRADAVFAAGRAGPAALLLAGAGTAWLLLPRGMPARWLGLVMLLPVLLPVTDVPAAGAFRFTLLDAGQGLAAVIRTREHALVFDTGPRFGDDFNAGSAVVLPYLRHAGIDVIDVLLLSHGDNDHSGGLHDIRAALPVRQILASAPEAIDPRPGPVRSCHGGMQWQWDDVRFEILHPAPASRLRGNDRSCVLRVSSGSHAVLLSGDIERHGENELLRALAPRVPRATVLVVPHHGSRTSSSMAFINAVAPRVALVAAGYRNRYGLPKQDIIARYRQLGATVLVTSRSGAMEFQIDKAGIEQRIWRESARRLWHSRP